MAGQRLDIDIQAAPDACWAAVTDVELWPRLTPSVTSVERMDDGALRVGSRTRIKQPRMAAIVWEVTDLEPGVAFTWVGRSPGVTTTAGHVLEPVADRTRLTLTVDHHGPLAGLIARLTARRTARYLNLEANGLKSCAETGVATQ
jgi:carbon monoxide dehydrogenase subunit G